MQQKVAKKIKFCNLLQLCVEKWGRRVEYKHILFIPCLKLEVNTSDFRYTRSNKLKPYEPQTTQGGSL